MIHDAEPAHSYPRLEPLQLRADDGCIGMLRGLFIADLLIMGGLLFLANWFANR